MRINRNSVPETYLFLDNGIFPNSTFPVLIYRKVFSGISLLTAYSLKKLFASHNWTNTWKGGVYTFDHYHSNTHEALGVIKGKTVIRFGGEEGRELEVKKGDVIVIPAGVAHRNMRDEFDAVVVGAYPDGKEFDMNFGKPGERPQTDTNIKSLRMPEADPVFGPDNQLEQLWRNYVNY